MIKADDSVSIKTGLYSVPCAVAVAFRDMRDTLVDCQDFISAIDEATREGGRIDEGSIMRYGECLKTTARKLNKKAKSTLAKIGVK